MVSGDKTTWRQQLEIARDDNGDTTPIIAYAPANSAIWDKEFDNGYGSPEGSNVLAWSETHVYFPVVYDGAEWIESAPRDPQEFGQPHVGSY